MCDLGHSLPWPTLRSLNSPIEAKKNSKNKIHKFPIAMKKKKKKPSMGVSVLTARARVPVNIPAFKLVTTYSD